MWTLEDLRAVDAVIGTGNFAAASRRLGVTRSAVSKAVRRVETALEVQLFVRTTHDVMVTDVGRAFHARAKAALVAADEATAVVRERQDSAMGAVRVSLPTSLGFAFINEALPDLVAHHPGLHVDVSLSDRMVDLVAEGFDIVIRIAATKGLTDSDLVARKLVSGRLRLCASPQWVAKNGLPLAVSDLAGLPCLAFSPNLEPERSARWPVAEHGKKGDVQVHGPFRADSALALLAAVLGGAGIGLLAGFLVSRPMAEGRLVHLLPAANTRAYSVYAVRQPSAYSSRAIDAVIDALRSWLEGMER